LSRRSVFGGNFLDFFQIRSVYLTRSSAQQKTNLATFEKKKGPLVKLLLVPSPVWSGFSVNNRLALLILENESVQDEVAVREIKKIKKQSNIFFYIYFLAENRTGFRYEK